ncbi:PEP-CTERM/exosortase system-associated acyltransferase [Salinicola endophyticus]|uniref:PEP-CTERM/exosortase system-associated acyltransferase n=1 Tax=Salinicola endophyticus TaxID=1949083 RepID=A0AB74U7D6_9GAMM
MLATQDLDELSQPRSIAGVTDALLTIFHFRLALSEDDKRCAFQLRHRVFCEELGFFSIDQHDRVERDAFDDNALHCLVAHRETGIIVGCLRVVKATGDDGEAVILPVEEHCSHLGITIDMGDVPLSRTHLCEISRVAIPYYFRTGGGSGSASAQEKQLLQQHGRQTFMTLGIGLNLCATALSGLLDRPHVLAMIEPRFQRLLARAGLRFAQVSPTVELLGVRAAFYIDQRRAERELSQTFQPLYAALYHELEQQYRLTRTAS